MSTPALRWAFHQIVARSSPALYDAAAGASSPSKRRSSSRRYVAARRDAARGVFRAGSLTSLSPAAGAISAAVYGMNWNSPIAPTTDRTPGS